MELDYIEAVGEDAVRFALEKVLGLVRGDMRNRGENVGTMGRRSLDAVTVVDPAFSGLVIDVEVLKIVVEVDAACTEITAKQGSVGGKDGGYVDMALATKRDREACLPLVEVGDDGGGQLTSNVLEMKGSEGR